MDATDSETLVVAFVGGCHRSGFGYGGNPPSLNDIRDLTQQDGSRRGRQNFIV